MEFEGEGGGVNILAGDFGNPQVNTNEALDFLHFRY